MTTYRICCFLRRFRAASNEPSEAVRDVFQAYADGGGGVVGEEALRRFLREVQGETEAGADAAAKEVMAFAAEQRLLKKGGLTAEGFHRWLFSDANAALDPRRGVYQDMGLPLSHYFIYTGHNSYLTGNQLSSGCSERPIVKALLDGVRVIELDLWPNAAKDEVEVLHGRTWTSPVELIKCLEAIQEHAFVTSPYPVILTLEDHLTPDLQAKVAKMLKETFGEMLYVSESEQMAEFPSPDELKGKIIISTKPPKEYLQTKSSKEEEQGVWGEEISDDKTTAARQMSEQYSDKYAAAEEEAEAEGPEAEKKERQGTDNEYRRLIAIQLTRRKHDMEQDLRVDPDKVTRLSLGEKAYEKAIVSHGDHIIRFTQRNLLRIFPRSTRITSSNYNPLMGWRYGVQMVAANMQGHGRKLWLTQGMFRANGGCGYVKKPDVLMSSADDGDPAGKLFDPTRVDLPVKTRLKVTVYMGDGWRFDFRKTHFDRCSPPDFYVRVGVAGAAAADTRMEQTRVVMDSWIPAWDHEFGEFPLAVPELALLRVEVHESDNHQKDEFAGQTCLPVWELRPGIRSVRLADHKGQPLPSVKLLMRFEFFPSPSSSSNSK